MPRSLKQQRLVTLVWRGKSAVLVPVLCKELPEEMEGVIGRVEGPRAESVCSVDEIALLTRCLFVH